MVDYSARVLRVQDHILANLDVSLSAPELADVAGISPYHFHRVFRTVTGESLMGHVRRLRLELAAHRLQHGSAPVTDVAFGSGYKSHEGFTRAFRARFGTSPSTWRDERGALLPKPAVEVRSLPARSVCALRHVGPYAEVDQTWGALMGWLARHGLHSRVQAHVGLCYDNPDVTETELIRYDAGVVMVDPPLPSAPVRTLTLPAGRYATLRHTGPLNLVSDSYTALFQGWVLPRGEPLANTPAVEHYLDTPGAVPDEALRTDLSVLLE